MDGYKFLMQNYNVGDRVCLFGFSRGAYTARALAGMLHKVGLLSRDNIEQIPFAYELYKSDDNFALAQGFKVAFSREVPIEFVGVWDTVASVGFITGKTLPFADVNTTIRVFRQALALDEHRAKFLPNLYHHSAPKQPSVIVVDPNGDAKPQPSQDTVPGRRDEIYETDVKEVWFAGCHTDVGGGSTPNTTGHSLANIPLRWMIQEAMRADCGIQFDMPSFARWNIPIAVGQDPSTSDAPSQGHGGNDGSVTEGSVTESNPADALDIAQPIHDDLQQAPAWWLLEIIPTQFTYQNTQDKWVSTWGLHLGRGRDVPPKPLFHESVKTRMKNPIFNYKPRAVYVQGTESYVT
ncbi:hypothetical protein EDB83DRAFT_359405 [Lactarius deliciosus]|nr:hypothetical protein EDB83DRAFT_359405 [Lactarius deliciosus]